MSAFPYRPLETFVEQLEQHIPIAFSRWGDGEWHSVFGRTTGRNCDKHYFYEQMGVDLRKVLLLRPSYTLGMQSLALSIYKGRIETWLQSNGLQDLDWIDADVFHHASEQQKLEPLLQALRARTVLVVGPAHLCKLEKWLNFADFVEVPPHNSYAALRGIVEALERSYAANPEAVVSVSAGMPGKLIVDRFYHQHPTATIIDFGSLFDYYAGKPSRQYQRRMPPPPVLA